jgi:hypothetical protein
MNASAAVEPSLSTYWLCAAVRPEICSFLAFWPLRHSSAKNSILQRLEAAQRDRAVKTDAYFSGSCIIDGQQWLSMPDAQKDVCYSIP